MNGLFSLDGRIALVTGASGQFGQVIVKALASAGAAIVLAGRDERRLAQAAGAIGEQAVATVAADLRREEEIGSVFDAVERHAGRLDILVNGAGVKQAGPLGRVTADELRAMSELNVAAPLLCTQHATPMLRRSGSGKVVNVGSIYGSVGVDTRMYEGSEPMIQASPAYAATKAALINLTRDLAVRLAPMNIQVNMMSPGGIAANQPAAFRDAYAHRTPAGRMATHTDLVGTLIYLCAPASDYVTGQNILIDGGFTAW